MKEVTYEDWQKNPTPRMMWVWDNNKSAKQKRKVIYFLDPKLTYPVVVLTDDETDTENFKHCAEIEEPLVEVEEQLIQEAVEYVSNYEGYGWTPHEGSPVFYAMVYSYIAGAESREKVNRKTEKEENK